MTTHTSLISLDDIVFEGRNKSYGAYVLRRIYGRHLYTAVLLAIAATAMLIAIPIVMQRLWPSATVAPDIIDLPDPINNLLRVELPKDAIAQPQASQPRTHVGHPPMNQVPTRVVPNDQVTPPMTHPDNTEAGKDIGESGLATVTGPTTALGTTTGVGTGIDTAAELSSPAEMKPFLHVEEMPDFVGGQAALAKYLQQHMHYPASALRESISGKVFVAFTVNSDGSIKDVEILKGLGYGTDEEAARVISSMPAWKPGRQNNHAVPVRYTLPITFRYE